MDVPVVASADRTAILQARIRRYLAKGYRVVSQTDFTAQMVRPKRFSLPGFFLGVGVFYLPWYLFRKDRTVYIRVDETGAVTED